MLSSRHFLIGVVSFFCVASLRSQTVFSWADTASDVSLGTSWVGGVVPGWSGTVSGSTANVAEFGTSGSVINQPVISSLFKVDSVRFRGGMPGAASFSLTGAGTIETIDLQNLSGNPQVVGVGLTFNQPATTIFNSGVLSISGPVISNSNSLTITNAGSFGISGSVANNGALGIILSGSGAAVGSINGQISGSGPVSVAGAHWTFGGANTYTGATTVKDGGILDISSDANLGAAPATLTPGSLVLNGGALRTSSTALALSANRGITAGSGGATLDAASGAVLSYAGVIAGAGGLRKQGDGTLALSGVSTYSGTTSIDAGTLRIDQVNALPTFTQLWLGANGVLELTRDQQVGAFYSAPASGSGVVIGSGATLSVTSPAGTMGGIIQGTVSGGGNILLNGAPDTSLTLTGDNSGFSGNTTVSSGTLYVGSGSALGTGTVTIGSGATLAVGGRLEGDVAISNSVVLSSGATVGGKNGDYGLILGGDVTVSAGASTLRVNEFVGITGTLKAAGGASALTLETGGKSDFGTLWITGTIDPTVSTITVANSGIAFGSAMAVPSAGSLSIKGTNAYVGIASLWETRPTVSSVLSLIDKANFTGVLGFDSGPGTDGTPAPVYGEAVDLSGFGSQVTLGSSTRAVLQGTITPSATNGYQFGNGGGALVVESALTGANAVTVNSTPIPGNYLLLGLRGNNTFTGRLNVANSIVVLDSANALPAVTGGDTGVVSLGTNGYIGYTENYTGAGSVRDFILTHIAPGGYSGSSVVGLDSADYVNSELTTGYPGSTRIVSQAIDLRGLGPIALGTATRATLTGEIYAPDQLGANRTLSLVAADDAELTVASSLLQGRVDGVVIGSATSPYAGGTVTLTGSNTYMGGTTLNSGVLKVAGAPLGSGPLTVTETALKPSIQVSGAAVLTNRIILGGILHIGTDPYAGGQSWGNSTTPIPAVDQLWLNGIISDLNATAKGGLDIYGSAALAGTNTFSGGVTIHGGSLWVENDSALGTGKLTFMADGSGSNAAVSLDSLSGPRTIANEVVFTGPVKSMVLSLGGANAMTFTGPVTVDSDLLITSSGAIYRPAALKISGAIGGSGRLNVAGSAVVTLSGPVSYTSGTFVSSGRLVFDSALPASGMLRATNSGYIGISFLPSSIQSDYLSKFDGAGTTGIIGFDTKPTLATNVYGGIVDLRNFGANARLGSSSSAALTGQITPQGSTYNFGGGGGLLEVRSSLTDNGQSPRSVYVSSDYWSPLTLRLAGVNSYTGGTVIENSAVIFGTSALPASGIVQPRPSSYVGTSDSANIVNPSAFISRIDPTASNFFLGFDSSGSGSLVSGDISLAGFSSSSDPRIYLATASTGVSIFGNITLPMMQTAYRFAGYKGGQLAVVTTLTDNGATPRSVIVGESGTIATAFDPSNLNARSTVTLIGNNTYTGGTTLDAGVLYVGSDSALGTGALTVTPRISFNPTNPVFGAAGAARTIANPIQIGSASLDVGSSYDLTLAGAITGYQGSTLSKIGWGNVTLAGNNSGYSGTIVVRDGGLTFQTAASVGTGALEFDTTSGSTVTFLDNATVNGISGSNLADVVSLTAGKNFTIVQGSNGGFAGRITGQTAGVTLAGPSMLRLSGASTFTGPVTITGTVLAANNSAFGAAANMITLQGGVLGAEPGTVISNPLNLLSGKLAGGGVFQTPASSTGINIGPGMILSPGMRDGDASGFVIDGSLTSGTVLTLGAGGVYNWGMDATGTDLVSVLGSVNITATPTTPFVINVGSFGAVNFNPFVAGSWTLLTANSITGFSSPSQFTLNTGGFQNMGIGEFNLSMNGGATSLMLNFTPVPEPSTYALMLAGLGLTFFASRRRRNRR